MTAAVSEIAEALGGLGVKYRADEPFKSHTSFRIGGPADLMVFPSDDGQLSAVIGLCREKGETPFVFGNGSNLLVSDDGVRGVCVKLASDYESMGYLGDGVVTCSAGTVLSHLCAFALEKGLTGLEFAYGIPGTAGGAAFMNAGAYGGEMKDVLTKCEHVSLPDGEPGEFSGDELCLGYRRSVYSDGGYVITRLYLKLEQGEPEEISAKMQELIGRRVDKQPLDMPSAGSFFKRPPGKFAGALIEQCGLKGFAVGGAMVSPKHAGFVVNSGGATCADVLALRDEVARKVKEQTGTDLEMEVRYVG